MATQDELDIQKFEQGVRRLGTTAPLVSAPALATPAAAPAAPAAQAQPRIAPRPLGTQIGQMARAGGSALVNSQVDTLGAGVMSAARPLRAAGGFARDAALGFTGAANPDAGQPLSLPSLRSMRPAARPAARPVAAAASVGAAPLNFSPGPSVRGRPRPAVSPAVTTPATSAAPADGVYRGTDAQGNSVYSDSAPGLANATALANGQRPTAPVPTAAAPAAVTNPAVANPMAARPTPTAPPAASTIQPVTAAPAPSFSPRGRQGGIIRNPDNGSVADQITRAMGDSRLRGSPSARRAVAEALMADAGYQAAERQSALATGDAADLEAIRNQAQATEGAQRRDLDAQQFNAGLQDRAADRASRLQEIQLARRPEVTTTADGTMGIVSSDGTFQPITQAGKPVRAAQAPRQTGELTEGEKLKSYTDRYNAISSDMTAKPEDKAAAIAALNADPIYSSLRPAADPTGAQAPPADAVAMLRSDPSKAAQFDQVFGQGAAARALGR